MQLSGQAVRRFWEALEDLPGCAESFFDWKDALGDEFDAASFLLRKTGALAARVGCPSPGGMDCPRRVVRHDDGSIVAVCGNLPAECGRLQLSPDDIAVLELDGPKLAQQLCACLDIRLDFRMIEGIPRTWQIGYVDVAAGAACRVDATFPTQEEDVSRVTAMLVGRTSPLALLVPTRRHLSPTAVAALSGGGSDVAVLDEIIDLGAPPGQLICAASPRTVFSRTWAATAPDAREKRAWVLPADARWEEMGFEFEVKEMVRVTFRMKTRRFEPADLNMQNNKTRRPNAQWVLLLSFAVKGGMIERTRNDFDKVESQKRQLSEKLRAAFGIPGDPIVWVKDEQAYRTLFVIRGAKLRNGH